MPGEIENFNVAFPHGLSLKDFMHRHGVAMNRRAVVQVLDRELQPFDVFLIRHSVEPVLQPSNGCFRFLRPLPGSS